MEPFQAVGLALVSPPSSAAASRRPLYPIPRDLCVAPHDSAARPALLLAQGLGKVADDAASIFVVHDLSLRILSPKVRGLIQPQSWYIDLKNVWVAQ